MIPGSWLEISEYDPAKAAHIFSQRFVQLFIVQEKNNQTPPQFPFLIVIKQLENTFDSKWKLDPHFKGFLWRTDSLESKTEISSIKYDLWIDFLLKDIKKAEKRLQDLVIMPVKGYFISVDESLSPRKIDNLLNKMKFKIPLLPYDINDSRYDKWEDLEIFEKPLIEKNLISEPKVSIIIPHFENSHFLCNVLKHLQVEFDTSPPFEVIIVDDGSSLETLNHISYFAHRHLTTLPLRIFKWKEDQTLSNGEKIFRAGASRNWGATVAKAENLFFLDSDMLVPLGIINEILNSLKNYDVVQFARKHIPFSLSSETCNYQELHNSSALYIEESDYWKNLFECQNWSELTDYWKYTCTYALALKNKTFFDVGRIRRNYIQYGFEDTDLGYRLHKENYRFYLNKNPLLHLTAKPDQSQSFLFKVRKINRIRSMARTFYKLNLNSNLYRKFQSLLD